MYKDRGIIKWAPFDALVGYNEIIKNYEYERNKIEKPILLEDKLAELDYILTDVIKENLEVEIEYFEDGYIKRTVGFIKRIDILNKNITICNHLKLNTKNIINIIK